VNSGTYKIKFIANRNEILYINSILDSYEGLGIMRTIDRSRGQVCIYSTEMQYKKVLNLLNALKKEGIYIDAVSVEQSENVDDW
jgi:hypothetical protein